MTCLCPQCPPHAQGCLPGGGGGQALCCGGGELRCIATGSQGPRMPLVCGQSEACGDRVIR